MFKKLVAIVSASVMTIAMAATAFAAGSINDNEQKILDALKAAGVPTAQIEQVRSVLLDGDYDIDAATAEQAIANVDKAKEIVAEAGITTIEELKANTAVLDQVVAIANEAAEVVGYDEPITVTVTDPTTGKATTFTGKTVTVTDNSKANPTSSSIKSTGMDFSTTATVVAGLGLSVAGVAIASKKRVSVNA